ncbi:MAG: cytochrome P450 [Ilumatobacter sp.]|uniref:cytochrome P450 n=1 Tax=Ilumatobacter sp. TaxID=1967498 RepID=UPI0026061515|nr:cytochrome P450 [Ilumatobacter sp.]MDJ0769589.1 cytochrome P450 [Ilumatobacter sp.]
MGEATGATELPPVTDWVNDWDWLDDGWGEHAIEIWNDVRDQCPMATTERYGRAHMPVTMDAVTEIAHDTEHFSSVFVSVARPDAVRRPAPPITSDPPDHHGHRRLLLPAFSPKAIAPMEDDLRRFCRSLIAGLEGETHVDLSERYVQHIPVHGICQLLGVPESDADMFRDWIFRNFQLAPRDNAVREQVADEMAAYNDRLLDQREAEPRDDLLSLIAHAEIDGEPVSRELKRGYVSLMIIAGIDTTWSAIGSGLWHFARHPAQRAALVAADDDVLLWTTATEEVLRYYAPVTMGRKVIADTEVAGCPVREGEQTLVTFPAANHDPAAFEDAHEFRIDRARNRHVAFGLGIHRCLGSNLARLELTVALQEWLRAFPDYELDHDRPTTWANGQVRGPRSLPVLLRHTVL